LTELAAMAGRLDGGRVRAGVELLISTGRDVLATAEQQGIAGRLRDAGAELLTDTCSYVAPILRTRGGPVMTDSAKWAFYAPGNLGFEVIFGSQAECLASAVTGRVVRDETLWGSA
jgi:predicted aconitase